MKKNSLLFFGFIGIIIGIFIAINLVFRLESKIDRWYQFKQIPNDSLDIVYMGNSHNMQGVIPQVIGDIINLRGFTLGVPGESLQTTYFELAEVFKTQSPKYIAIETYTLDTNLNKNDGHVFAFIDSVPLNLNILNTTFSIYNPSNAYNYFSFIRQHASIWKQPELLFSLENLYGYKKNNDDPIFTFYLKSDGYFANDTQITDYHMSFIDPPKEPINQVNLDLETIEYLKKIIKMCEENNAELVLFTMPEIRDMLGYEHRILDYSKIANDFNLSYFDLAQNEYSLIHFSDSNHLTQLGSIRASLQIAHNLSNSYDLPINQEIEAEYQQMNIDDYSLEELTWQFYHFKLHSKNGNLEKNQYNYVVDFDGKSAGGRPDGDSEAAVIIAFEQPGEYRLTMNIYNPITDYNIKQNIIFNLPLE